MRRNLSAKHGGKIYRVWSEGRAKRLRDYCRIFQERPPDLRVRMMCTGCSGTLDWPPCPDYERCSQNQPKVRPRIERMPLMELHGG